jgi:hypothetical protein
MLIIFIINIECTFDRFVQCWGILWTAMPQNVSLASGEVTHYYCSAHFCIIIRVNGVSVRKLELSKSSPSVLAFCQTCQLKISKSGFETRKSRLFPNLALGTHSPVWSTKPEFGWAQYPGNQFLKNKKSGLNTA